MATKFTKEIEKLKNESDKLDLGLSEELIIQVAEKLGPSIYSVDQKFVDANSKEEIERIKNEFLIGELKLEDTPSLYDVIYEILEKLELLKNKKYRVLVYALLKLYFDSLEKKSKGEEDILMKVLGKIKNFIVSLFKKKK